MPKSFNVVYLAVELEFICNFGADSIWKQVETLPTGHGLST